MTSLIKTADLPVNKWTAPLIAQLKRIVFDANVYLMLGKDSQYIAGERAYKKAMKLLEIINSGGPNEHQ